MDDDSIHLESLRVQLPYSGAPADADAIARAVAAALDLPAGPADIDVVAPPYDAG